MEHSLPPELLVFPVMLSAEFEGFGEKTFHLLQLLRERPTIAAYREHKEEINRHISSPFKIFRDDLVLNWVLPNQLALETQKNVFSRLLKNDFGAGGCHHHVWLSFYRPGYRRLSDIQLAHTVRDNGFTTSLYIGDNAPSMLRSVKAFIRNNPSEFIHRSNAIVADERWTLNMRVKYKADANGVLLSHGQIEELPESLSNARGIWWSSTLDNDRVVAMSSALVPWALDSIEALWPMYRYLLQAEFH